MSIILNGKIIGFRWPSKSDSVPQWLYLLRKFFTWSIRIFLIFFYLPDLLFPGFGFDFQ